MLTDKLLQRLTEIVIACVNREMGNIDQNGSASGHIGSKAVRARAEQLLYRLYCLGGDPSEILTTPANAETPANGPVSTFAYFHGRFVPPPASSGDQVRLYVNLNHEHAPSKATVVALRLNRYRIPFSLKFISTLDQNWRSDTFVIYTSRRLNALSAEVVADVTSQTRRAATPLFTHRIDHGLGLAESPVCGRSFGSERSRMLANAILNAIARVSSILEVHTEVLASLVNEGIDPLRLHLNPGSSFDYSA